MDSSFWIAMANDACLPDNLKELDNTIDKLNKIDIMMQMNDDAIRNEMNRRRKLLEEQNNNQNNEPKKQNNFDVTNNELEKDKHDVNCNGVDNDSSQDSSPHNSLSNDSLSYSDNNYCDSDYSEDASSEGTSNDISDEVNTSKKIINKDTFPLLTKFLRYMKNE